MRERRVRPGPPGMRAPAFAFSRLDEDKPLAPRDTELKTTPLTALHRELGARMAAFAGYDMPINFPLGLMKEHLHTRAQAGLFDVSHMGQAAVEGPGAAEALEALVPGDLKALKPGRMRYTQLTDETGGILDDLMITRDPDETRERFVLVVNAACKDTDLARIEAHLPAGVALARWDDRALIALQGPRAASVLAGLGGEALSIQPFMSLAPADLAGVPALVSRSGYTGEDGFEISVPAEAADSLARRLLDHPAVEAAGLGARDSLRLEAGLALYGHDIDETTSPVEAALGWSVAKRRRAEGGFPGAARIGAELRDGPARKRVGIRLAGRQPAREGSAILAPDGGRLGAVTSGGFSPTLAAPIAMGYVPRDWAEPGRTVGLEVRGKVLPGEVCALPFVPARYYRG